MNPPATSNSFTTTISFTSSSVQVQQANSTPYLHKLRKRTPLSEKPSASPSLDDLSDSTDDYEETPKRTKVSKQSKKIAKTPKTAAESPFDDEASPSDTEKKPRAKRSLWKPHEDAKLLKLVQKYGQKWTEIGRKIGGRTCKQVRDRYLNNLRPNINTQPFTKEEDEQLVELYLKLGTKWKQIAELLPGRTESQVKNRFYIYHKDTRAQFSKTALQVHKNSSASTQATVDQSPTDFEDRFCLEGVALNKQQYSYNTFQKEFFVKEEEQILMDYNIPEESAEPQGYLKDYTIDLDEHFKKVQSMLFGEMDML